ncbi:MAG: hypothetical protein EKK57_00810 [Proteobacteria bacterium]|nr:MAG: hypothetical protein EKK57_00810 [Pseudomonadota bacterium]
MPTTLPQLPNLPKLKDRFRANIYAQGIAFIINISLYIYSQNALFIWTELAALSFIGAYNAKSPTFLDRNILNHFISVMCYYLISLLIGSNQQLYLILIFIFTYSFFILRNNGYHKSLNLWMYIQALLIGTTFTAYPFHYKIIATVIGYVEAQMILKLAFHLLRNNEQYEAEKRYVDVVKISVFAWLDTSRPEVRLALRGSFTAAILYALCSSFHDMKPNWAVVTAVSCLQRDDFIASFRAMKGVSIGSVIGWPIAAALIYFLKVHIDTSTILIWVFTLIALVCSFELAAQPRLKFQILNTVFFLLAVTCVGISLQINSMSYMTLKVINSLIGVVGALLSLFMWRKLHQVFDEVKQN